MTEEISCRIYSRMRDYSKIIELSTDTPKISNLAYEQMLISFVELVHKFNGLDLIFQKIKSEENEVFKLKLAALLLPYNKVLALDIFKSLINSKSMSISNNATDVLFQKYSTIDEIIEGYKSKINEIKSKRKI